MTPQQNMKHDINDKKTTLGTSFSCTQTNLL